MDIVCLGDIVGGNALSACVNYAQESRVEPPCFMIANAENASGGFGLVKADHDRLIKAGFDMLTGGNHIWDKREIFHYIAESKIVRPCNFPAGTPGEGYRIIEKEGTKLGVINVLGRVFMSITTLDCPFRCCDRAIEELRAQGAKLILVDVHAEATSEKLALAHYLDGRVNAIVGTHTHVPTADMKILPKGSAYVTDLGACAPIDSVIGISTASILPKFLTGLPGKSEISSNPPEINGVRIRISPSGKVDGIDRIK